MTRLMTLVAVGLLAWSVEAQAASISGQSGGNLGGDGCCNDNLGGNGSGSDNGVLNRIRQLQRFGAGKDVRGSGNPSANQKDKTNGFGGGDNR